MPENGGRPDGYDLTLLAESWAHTAVVSGRSKTDRVRWTMTLRRGIRASPCAGRPLDAGAETDHSRLGPGTGPHPANFAITAIV